MDAASAAEAVATLVGSGVVQGLSGQAAIEAISAIKNRIHEVFRHDRRATDALEQIEQGGSDPARLVDLASALRWHAERNEQFAAELVGWARLGIPPVVQHVHANRDAHVAGRDQTVIHLNAEGS